MSVNIADVGLSAIGEIKVYGSSAHESIKKAMSVAGIGRNNFVEIKNLKDTDILDAFDLEDKIKNDQKSQKIVVATIGKINTGEFDNLEQIYQICKKHNIWLHVDGAFGLFARLSDKHKKYTAFIGKADSISSDMHKWLNTPYDCGIFFTRHPQLLKQTCHSQAFYMGQGNMPDGSEFYMNMGLENSRRFRALPVMFSLLSYGEKGIKDIVIRNCQLAEKLGEWIKSCPDYQLLYEVKLNIVLFKPKNLNNDETIKLIAKINSGQKMSVSKTMLGSDIAIRIAVSNFSSSIDDFEECVAILKMSISSQD